MGMCARTKNHFLFLIPPAKAQARISLSHNHPSPCKSELPPARPRPCPCWAVTLTASQWHDRLTTAHSCATDTPRSPLPSPRSSPGTGDFGDQQHLLPITVTQSHWLHVPASRPGAATAIVTSFPTSWGRFAQECPCSAEAVEDCGMPGRREWQSQMWRDRASLGVFGKGKEASVGDSHRC